MKLIVSGSAALRRWKGAGLVVAVVVVGLIAASLLLPANYQVCHASVYTHESECSQHTLGTYVLEVVLSFFDAHNGLLTAVATVFVAFFTWTLWRTNNKAAEFAAQTVILAEQQTALEGLQSDILAKQTELGRLQFFAEHRPTLVLKDVYFSSADDFTEVTFEMVNVGQSLAMISGGFLGLDFVSDPRQFKVATGRNLEPLDNNGFKAGQFRPFAIRTTDETQRRLDYLKKSAESENARVAETFYNEVNKPPGPFYFFGMIYYTDEREAEFGSTYLSVFRRKWEPSTGAFDRTGPWDEYAD
jgi:hypothetical protein